MTRTHSKKHEWCRELVLSAPPSWAKPQETKRRINLPGLTQLLGHTVLPRPGLPCFWVTLSPSHRDYLPRGRCVTNDRGARSTSPPSALEPGRIRQAAALSWPHNLFSLMKKSLFQLLPVSLSLNLIRKQLLFGCFSSLFDLSMCWLLAITQRLNNGY